MTHDEFYKNADAILDLYLDGAANETVARQALNKLHVQRNTFFTTYEAPVRVSQNEPRASRKVYDYETDGE